MSLLTIDPTERGEEHTEAAKETEPCLSAAVRVLAGVEEGTRWWALGFLGNALLDVDLAVAAGLVGVRVQSGGIFL